mgnify:CR=1 FL=1
MAEKAATARKAAPRGGAPKNARRRSREFALQGLYQWQLAGAGITEIKQHLATVAGFDVVDQPMEVKRRIGYVPETATLYDGLTGGEYLELIGCLYHLDPKTAATRRRELLELETKRLEEQAAADGGEAHSAEAVRFRIKQMIDQESPDDILSDDTIVAKLKSSGIDIARRTVAKYRDSLRIPSSVERRREKQSLTAKAS